MKSNFQSFISYHPPNQSQPSNFKLTIHCTIGILIILCIVICVLILRGTFDEYLPGNRLHSIPIVEISDNPKPYGIINDDSTDGPNLQKLIKEALK